MGINMKTLLVIIIFSLYAIPCTSQKRETIFQSTIKLEGKNTNIRDLIDIDGYYQDIDDKSKRTGRMFFEDGTCVTLFWFKEGVTEDMKRENLSQAIYSWKQKGQVRWGTYWGVYTINKDTIVLQNVTKAGLFNMSWSFNEIMYKVLDRQTLKLIYYKDLLAKDDGDPYEIGKKNFTDKFVPTDSFPSSDCWLKEEKWIWRNEQDWKDYMEKIKTKKK